MVAININLGSKIRTALEKGCRRNMNFQPIQKPNEVFSLKNPYILEAIPDSFIGTKQFDELMKLEGMRLDDVLPIINSVEKKAVSFSTNPFSGKIGKIDLYEELAKYYDKLAKQRAKDGMVSSVQIYKDFAQKARDRKFSEKEMFSKLQEQIYNDLRKADYPITGAWNHKISDITAKSNNYVMATEESGWHYRIAKKRHEFGWSRNDKAIDRISVNANTDKELIVKLDEYFGTGKAKGYYKTPSDSASWLERHDPITIYLHEPASPRILKDIENLTRNHIRSTENVLFGYRFAPGLALEKSPSTQEIEKLLSEITAANPAAGAAMRENLVGNLIRKGLPKDSPLSASAGEMTSMHRLLDLIKAS